MKPTFLKCAVMSACLLAAAGSAHAADIDGTAVFTGTILDTCAVTIPTPGVLGNSVDATVVGSEVGIGQSALASVVTNNPRSTVQVIAPTAFTTAPDGSDTDSTFEASYELGGNIFNGPIATLLGIGANPVTVDVSATKSSGSYEGGAYVLEATVRCITQ